MLISKSKVSLHYLGDPETRSELMVEDQPGYFLTARRTRWNGSDILDILVKSFGAKPAVTGKDGRLHEVHIKALPTAAELELAALSRDDMSRIKAGGSRLQRLSDAVAMMAFVAGVLGVIYKIGGVI